MSDERGHLKVFIGMAPGVGKTYRMLQEGGAEADSGRDVVIGYLEPHGRVETLAQAEGLELLPRRRLVYRGTPLEEMDLPAVLARKPELCLIDELAHTNAPGVEHEKRYEDVRAVIEAGIDVFSTVNVQHLESLNDQVTQLTGARVRETIPDEVLSAADEVVLIDLTPEALIGRLRAGKVYRPERVQAALNNFFKIENLSALRETALRQVAEEVEVKRLIHEPSPIVRRDEEGVAAALEPAPQAIAERLLALVTLAPDSERVVRRAWRSAQRLDAVLDVLVVRPSGRPPSPQDRKRLEALAVLRAGRTAGGSHDEHVEHGVQALGRAPRASHNPLGVRRQRHQRQQTLGDRLRRRFQRSRHALLVATHDRARLVDEPLDFDLLGHLAQRRLAQRREVLDLEEVVQRRLHALGPVHLARAQAPNQRLWGEIDQHDLVGRREDVVGDRLAYDRAGQLGHLVVEALQVLHVDRREHVDSRVEHVAYVLIALLVLDARRVGVRQLVDQAQLGLAREHRRQVHLLQRFVAVLDVAARDDLQPIRLSDGLVATMRL